MARIHNVPLDTPYCPSVDKGTIPMGWTLANLDVQRTTVTNGKENADGKRGFDIDHWCGLKELDEKQYFKGWQGVTPFRFAKPDPTLGYHWCDGARLTTNGTKYKGAAKPRDCMPEDLPAKDGPKQQAILETYAKYEKGGNEALRLRNFQWIAPDIAIQAMIMKDGTKVAGELAMEELAKPPWLREAYICFEGKSDEAEVASFQEYYREFRFSAPSMPREPQKEAPQPHR